MAAQTFMQAVYEGVLQAVENEPGKTELRGLNRQQVIDVVKAITEALDKLPPGMSLHTVMFGVMYVRNVLQAAMEANAGYLKDNTGGHA